MVTLYPGLVRMVVSLCLLLSPFALSAQTTCIPSWHHEIIGPLHTESRDIRYMPDGTNIVVGRAQQGSQYDGVVMRVSATGQVIWSTITGGTGDDELTGICVLNNGDLLLYGTTGSYGYPDGKVWLVCVNSGGTVLWSRQLGATAPGTDRPRSILQFTDGDIVGTYTLADSSAASDAVVFKMGLNGSLRWSKRFDHGGRDAFSSIGFSGNTIYAAGFYSAGLRAGVMVQLNSANGALIKSQKLLRTPTLDEEVIGLEVYNNVISYGLMASTATNTTSLVLQQTDLQDNIRYGQGNMPSSTNGQYKILRTPDEGFLVMDKSYVDYGGALLKKFNRYGSLDWSRLVSEDFQRTDCQGIYPTPDGGAVTTAFYEHAYYTNGINRIQVSRFNNRGEAGTCLPNPGFHSWSPDTASVQRQNFSWQGITDLVNGLQDNLAMVGQPFAITERRVCEANYCTDKTRLPPDCNKTYRIEYSSSMATIFMDAVATTDGGRIAVGVLKNIGYAVKFNQNGDIAWSKYFGEMHTNGQLNRVVRTSDGNLLASGLIYKDRSHNAYKVAPVIKFDNNGQLLWSRNFVYPWTSDQWIRDLTETPDGGFILLINEGYGSSADIYVVRFDANAQVVWKKELLHPSDDAYYRSVACTPQAVWVAAETPKRVGSDIIGLDKLDMTTGDRLWSKTMTFPGNFRLQVNRLCVYQDTAWLFLNQEAGIYGTGNFDGITAIGIDPSGKVTKAFDFKYEKILPVPFNGFNNPEITTPTVTLTADHDFVFANRIQQSGGDIVFNISRVSREGQLLWSVNHPSMKDYNLYNLRPHARGILLTGAVRTPKNSDPQFHQGFMVKVDSAGQIVYPNTGDCRTETANPVVSPRTIVPGPDIIYNTNDGFVFNVVPGTIFSVDVEADATLQCYDPTQCGQVTMGQQGNGCSLKDTLSYFLENGSACGAIVNWQYDTAFFKPALEGVDTLRLVPKQTGTSTIKADLEGYCFLDTKVIQAAVLLSASQMKLGKDTLVCEGGSVRISAGPGYATYRWNNGHTDSFLVVQAPGKYYVDVTDNCGGTGTDTVVVGRAGDALHFTNASPIKCNKDETLLEVNTGLSSYEWSTATGVIGQGNRIIVNPSITTKYYIQAEKWPGCQVRDSFEVSVLHSPDINLPPDTWLCTGDSIFLDAGIGFTSYSWNTGENTQAIMARQAGKYQVMAYYTNGCPSKGSFELRYYALPQPALDKNGVLCAGATRQLTAGQFASYSWNDGSTGTSLPVSNTGTYWVTVTDNNGCKGADTTRIVNIARLPAGFLTTELELCQNGELKIIPLQSYASYHWSDRSGGPTLTIRQPGTYWLEATDRNGCKGKDTVTVKQKECLTGLYIPNAFTPNGDLKNDIFTPLLYGQAEYIVFTIYNRWGEIVYDTRTLKQGWDGKVKGMPAPSGTYVWQCRYKLAGLAPQYEKGMVQLIR